MCANLPAVRTWTHINQLKDSGWSNVAITWGVFDGVHLGHQRILREVVQRARVHGLRSVAVIFDPHPQSVLYGRQVGRLTSLDQRIEAIASLGIDGIVVHPFDREFAQHSADAFVQNVLLPCCAPHVIVLGPDSAFGKDRQGDLETLKPLGEQFHIEVSACGQEKVKGRDVNSSGIRKAIRDGDVETAEMLMGRPYAIAGVVVAGAGRGRTVGFPTANLGKIEQLRPAVGVYAARTEVGAEKFGSLVNIGVRPTFDPSGTEIHVEVHLLDFSGRELKGESLTVEFLGRLRDERQFPNVDALVAQIEQDEKEFRNRFHARVV